MTHFGSKGINEGYTTVSILVNPFCRSLPMLQINGNLKSNFGLKFEQISFKNNNYVKTASKGKQY